MVRFISCMFFPYYSPTFFLSFITLIPFTAFHIIFLLFNQGSIHLLRDPFIRWGCQVALPGCLPHRLGSPRGFLHRGGWGVRDMRRCVAWYICVGCMRGKCLCLRYGSCVRSGVERGWCDTGGGREDSSSAMSGG